VTRMPRFACAVVIDPHAHGVGPPTCAVSDSVRCWFLLGLPRSMFATSRAMLAGARLARSLIVNAGLLITVAAAGAIATAWSGVASADPESLNPDAFDLSGAIDRPVPPTHGPFEVVIAGGYTQGAGGAGMIGNIEDVAGPGGTVELQLAYRVSPGFSAGVYGAAARFRHGDAIGDGSRAYGASAGLQAVWHTSETRSVDPWFSVGVGWRGLWIDRVGIPASSMQGVEIARLQLGIDYRLSPWLAVSPVISASLSMFLVENAPMPTDFTVVEDKRLNLYGFAGVLGRFDLGD
jgi:hypothetical protein